MEFWLIDPKGHFDGLLGLDLLLQMGAVIDVEQLSLKFNPQDH